MARITREEIDNLRDQRARAEEAARQAKDQAQREYWSTKFEGVSGRAQALGYELAESPKWQKSLETRVRKEVLEYLSYPDWYLGSRFRINLYAVAPWWWALRWTLFVWSKQWLGPIKKSFTPLMKSPLS